MGRVVAEADPVGHPPLAGSTRARLLVVSGGLTVAAAIVYLAAVRTGWGQRLDEALKAWWVPVRRDVQGAADSLAELLGAPLLALTVLAATGVLVARRRLDQLIPLAAIVGGGVALALLLKRVLLDREELVGGTFPPDNTWPSGHGAVVATGALVAVWLAPASRRGAVVALAALASAVGCVAIYLASLHRPSDIVGSFLLMGAWTGAVLAVGGQDSGRALGLRRFMPVLVGVAGAALAVGAGLAVQATRARLDADTAGAGQVLGAGLLVGGAGIAVVTLVGWAMGDRGVASRAQLARS